MAILTHYKIFQYGVPIIMVGIILGGISPFIAAFITKYKYDKNNYRIFLRSHIKFRVNVIWYLWIILIPFFLYFIPMLAEYIKTGIYKPIFNQPIYMVLVYLPVMILGGGLEETGWRGLLLPELLGKTNKFQATIIVSLIWFIWHLPLWLIEGSNQSTINIWSFGFSILLMSFLFTILYVKTESIGMAILFHAFFNTYPMVISGGGINPYIDNMIKLVICLFLFFVLLKDALKKKE